MPRGRRSALIALAAAAFAAACTESPLQPTPSELDPSFARGERGPAAPPSVSPRYFVVAQGTSLPEGFEWRASELGVDVHAAYPELGVAVVSASAGHVARRLLQMNGIAFVEPEPTFRLDQPVSIDAPEAFVGGVASPDDPTTAARYARQWNMRAIDADVAWAAGRLGSGGVSVAILDGGVDYMHVDLAGRVDLSRSVSFVPEDDAYVTALFPARHLVTDIGYHGTHVAATVVSNGLATAGVTSKTTLIGIKVCSVVLDNCPGGAVFAGIVHAVQVGADVANMSLGGPFSKREFPGAVSAFQRLFNWASQGGTTFVVSAGNSASDLDRDADGFKLFCTVANVICVSATGPTAAAGVNGPWVDPDAPASYSNHGRSAISVAAPGGTAAGAVWAACSTSTLITSLAVCRTGTFILGLGGTSMAAPHVSGVAALLVEDLGRDPAQIKARLQQTADDLGQPGVDPYYGKGRVNAAAAVGAD